MCIGNGELRAARSVYEETLRLGIAPHLHAYNCLINAYAAHFRLGDVVRIRCNVAAPAAVFSRIMVLSAACSN